MNLFGLILVIVASWSALSILASVTVGLLAKDRDGQPRPIVVERSRSVRQRAS